MDAVREAHPDATMTVWAEDEHRLGLLPVTRRVWAKRGQRPIAWVRRRYQWLYVFGFVCPDTGETWWALVPTVHTQAMTTVLATFAQDMGIDATRRVVLVVDGAGWHRSGKLVVPDGIDLVFLPPASPELQPAERVWPLINEPVANRIFTDLEALEAVLVQRCRTLRAEQPTIAALTHYWWWPAVPSHPMPS